MRITFLIIIVIPLMAWFLVKPVRLIAPEIFDIKCFENGVCIDIESDYVEARKLHDEAIDFLSKGIGSFEKAPTVIFCSTWECAEKFGLGKRSAVTFGSYGSAISPRAWKSYYVRHELIHQLQYQKLGSVKCLIQPAWLIEGMAYSLSQDPRQPLNQPWEGYRTKFSEWLAAIDGAAMWTEAAKE